MRKRKSLPPAPNTHGNSARIGTINEEMAKKGVAARNVNLIFKGDYSDFEQIKETQSRFMDMFYLSNAALTEL